MPSFFRAVAAVLLCATSVAAQSGRPDDVPADYRPPAGMCRVWIDGVPASQQPAPTDCSSAMRNKPSRSKVLFGDRAGAMGLPYNALNPTGSAAYGGGSLPAAPVTPARGRTLGELDDAGPKRIQHGELCLDTNLDGLCDDTAPAVWGCVDANRDGKCDEPRREMDTAIEAGIFRAGSAVNFLCIDRDRDGRCDDTWPAANLCLDRDGDGKCDTPMATAIKGAEPAKVEAAPAAAPAPEKAASRPKPVRRPD